jgi:hypothetical protein
MVVESLGRIKYEALSGERDRVQSRISAITVAPKKSDNYFIFVLNQQTLLLVPFS